jgi:hypothetical protein
MAQLVAGWIADRLISDMTGEEELYLMHEMDRNLRSKSPAAARRCVFNLSGRPTETDRLQ